MTAPDHEQHLHMIKRYWIIALITALLLGAFATTLLTGYVVAYRALGEEISMNTLPLTSDNVYSEIQKDLLLSIHISSLMAHDTFVWDWVLDGEQDPERIVMYLGQIREKYDMVTSFFVSERTKRYYHPDGILKEVSPRDPQDIWYFRARGMNTPYEINIDIDTADQTRLTIFINHQVHGYDGELLGVTGVGLELSQVKHVLNTYQEKYASRVFFINNSGIVLLHADDFDLPTDLHAWENFATAAENILSTPETSFRHHSGDHVYFVSSRYIPEFDLFLIILKDNDALYERLRNRLKLNFAIGLVITMVVVAIVGIILKRYNLNLEKLARFDTLTGAFNRDAFALLFTQAVKDKHRRKVKLSLVFIDFDDFKLVNDKYGHHVGDLVLKAFSRQVLNLTREVDALCRWGGEEFVLLLGDCSVDQAEKVVEKIKTATSSLDVQPGMASIRLTFSAGVVEHNNEETLTQVVDRADKLMYQAKAQGKNRVVSQATYA